MASQTYEEHRNLGVPQMALFRDQAEQIAREKKDEAAVRKYLEEKDILSVPAWVQHYQFASIPAYVAAFGGLGEADDFTGPSRLKENSTRYIDPPSDKLGYFALTEAKDPRGEAKRLLDLVDLGTRAHHLPADAWRGPVRVARIRHRRAGRRPHTTSHSRATTA